jgi:ArsR family transcriptional regulator, cadmium/lead-responsive transcriptional repressor
MTSVVVAPIAQARFFRVLGDRTRLAILSHLLTGPHTVSELISKTGLSQSRLSNHLACLRWCKIVEAERQGRNMIYSVTDPRLHALFAFTDDLVADKAEHLASCGRIGPDWV